MATRASQKQRTRTAIVDACDRLLDRGVEPTIELIVGEAEVSRATVYRYFGTVDEIVWQVVADRSTVDSDEVVDAAGSDVHARVLRAEDGVNEFLFSTPDRVRRFTMAWLQRLVDGTAQPGERPVRRLRYIDRALEPVADRFDDDLSFRLRHGLALAMGSEPMLALLDACELSPDDARRVCRFVATAVLDAALDEVAAGDDASNGTGGRP